jgi:hypothetical protein
MCFCDKIRNYQRCKKVIKSNFFNLETTWNMQVIFRIPSPLILRMIYVKQLENSEMVKILLSFSELTQKMHREN